MVIGPAFLAHNYAAFEAIVVFSACSTEFPTIIATYRILSIFNIFDGLSRPWRCKEIAYKANHRMPIHAQLNKEMYTLSVFFRLLMIWFSLFFT